ncbi:MAG TPA: hypothetical protein VF847_08515, partial [Candidatus Deferrimicrobiaceae bacterium]
MRRAIGVLTALLLCAFLAAAASAEEKAKEPEKGGEICYARCNLKVLNGKEITWVNWQAAPTFIPVGTKLRVTRAGSTASVVNVETNAAYTMDIGGDGEALLEKFVTKTPVDVTKFPEDVQANIRNAVAKIGMTKEQVYIAMGPPTNLGKARTNAMTYE